MKKKFDAKKLLTATNILIVVLIVFYFLDRFLPFPEGYTGYRAWNDELPPALNYIFGFCGGLLTNFMARGSTLIPYGLGPYRYFTDMFLHGHVLHLIANVVGLFFIGNYTEKRFGWWLTLILFFLTGFTESYITDPLFAAMFPKKAAEISGYVSVGASGGIFGLMGASLSAILFDIKSFKQINKPTLIVSVVYGIFVTYVVGLGWSTMCHNVALIVGLVTGTLVILPFYIIKKRKSAQQGIE